MSQTQYIPTIGIECHVQLKTRTKLFSGANNDARDAKPNTMVSPICFGLPGTLPVLNREAVQLAIRAGLALNAEIAENSYFERKHYFYPDLPKGYQITQLAHPTIGAGSVTIHLEDGSDKVVRIHHAHIEEDAGKLTHPNGVDYSLVDLNRAGTPLIEIVSEPDMHSASEAKAYAQEIYLLMTYVDVTYGDLYHGNIRFDVNVSVAPIGAPLGTRTETKNLNSFKAVERAVDFEINRQVKLLDKNERVVQETRGWNEDRQATFSQRSKEDAHDYRYFPDADIPPLKIERSEVEAVAKVMPKLPNQYRQEFTAMGLDGSVITALLGVKSNAEIVAEIYTIAGKETASRVAHWLSSVLGSAEGHTDISSIGTARLVELSGMVDTAELSSTAAKDVLISMLSSPESPRHIAEQKNLLQVSDENAIAAIVEKVLADPANAKAIADIKAGNDKVIGYLIGLIMKESKGKANPGLAQKLIRKRIS
ncbi:Asp-tRNA(Asn)/Glu-tRNA(Gln) amidotransferase subunit GatB [Candidatus Saccharibacteria bacterium]|nr:Asp-tRNA(Asn)/Glu-tRNA(Gln) amidotransferase subunit GatB [Candidatus Saccharibacteria bacterium]NCU40203.1 Asp-tRNA(Asn)/Glu-tRNA(Gln) amidotransferase subunit GatB [Candidatus Saccharibacteria bacterium]